MHVSRLSLVEFNTIRDKYRRACADAAGVTVLHVLITRVSVSIYVSMCMYACMYIYVCVCEDIPTFGRRCWRKVDGVISVGYVHILANLSSLLPRWAVCAHAV